jgi:UPF0271 protein
MCRRIRYTMVEEVLDTAALIAWPMNRMRGCFAVPSQRVELQRIAPEREIVIDSVELQWREPSKNSVTQATEIARLSGDMAGLSETDLSIFALVIEIQAVLVSDDYRLQNLAEKSGLKWISVTTEGIRSMWESAADVNPFNQFQNQQVLGKKILEIAPIVEQGYEFGKNAEINHSSSATYDSVFPPRSISDSAVDLDMPCLSPASNSPFACPALRANSGIFFAPKRNSAAMKRMMISVEPNAMLSSRGEGFPVQRLRLNHLSTT